MHFCNFEKKTAIICYVHIIINIRVHSDIIKLWFKIMFTLFINIFMYFWCCFCVMVGNPRSVPHTVTDRGSAHCVYHWLYFSRFHEYLLFSIHPKRSNKINYLINQNYIYNQSSDFTNLYLRLSSIRALLYLC